MRAEKQSGSGGKNFSSMEVVEVNIGGKWYKAEQPVVDALQECYRKGVAMRAELDGVYEAINELQVKEETAKVRRTRDIRMLAWEAKKRLFGLLPKNWVRQQELWES